MKSKDCYYRAVRWFEDNRAKISAQWAVESTEFEAEARYWQTIQRSLN